MGRGRSRHHLGGHDPQPDRLCAQRAELTLIIQGLRSMLPRPAKAAGKRALSIGELVRKEGPL